MSSLSLFDKYIIQNTIRLRKKYMVSVDDIAEEISSNISFIRQVESYLKHYNLYHLYKISKLFKRKDPTFNIEQLFPNNNYYKNLGFSKANYCNLEALEIEIETDMLRILNARKKLKNKNMEGKNEIGI